MSCFVTQVGYVPTDGGVYMLAQAFVDAPSVKLWDPKMERFPQVSPLSILSVLTLNALNVAPVYCSTLTKRRTYGTRV